MNESGSSSVHRVRRSIRLFAVVFLVILGGAWNYTAMTRFVATCQPLHAKTEKAAQDGSKLFTPTKFRTFRQAMQEIDWDEFTRAATNNRSNETAEQEEVIWKNIFYAAFDFAIREPHSPINDTCVAPSLEPPTQQECDSFATAFAGPVRTSPLKLGHAVQLGFDVDTLEVHLNELYDVVDKFFIIEWTQMHNRYIHPKPLTWEAGKIVHA